MPHIPRNKSSAGDVDAADVTYAPADNSDFGGSDPGNVDDALDYIADCCAGNADLLDELLPAAAPDLSSMSASTGVSGNLSFGPSAVSNPAGYTNHPTLDIGGTIDTTSPNRGIISVTADPTGTLADNIAAEANDSYPANAFGPGDSGTLSLLVNGSSVHNVDLSLFGSGATVNGNGSGFTLSAATSVQFPNGNPFANRKYRTGTWVVDSADLRTGYNTIQVQHAETTTNTTQTFVYIVDDDTTSTTITGQEFINLSATGSKYLSGIEYHTSASATFQSDISNAYRNTYSSSSSAVSYPTPDNCSINSQTLTTPTEYTNSLTNFGQTATLNSSRIITNLTTYNGFRARTRVLRTIQGTTTASYVEGFSLLIDTVSDDATDLNDNMLGESYRIPSNADFDTDLSSTWDETISLISATSGYSDGLQIINATLDYPVLDFTAATNGPAGNPNYSTASGTRYWYRYFTNATGAGNFRLILEGNASIIAESASFTGGDHNEVKISVKFPQGAGSGTGWLDITQNFVPGSWNDGDGCYASSFGSDTTLPTSTWGISIGTRNSADAYDKMYVRVTTDTNFIGDLTQFGVEWAVT